MSASGTGQAPATMQVPMLDLQAQYRPIRDAVIDVVTRVCDSQRFILGPEVEGMERAISSRSSMNTKQPSGMLSGPEKKISAP